ncbi:hypothetical protein WJX81_001087 [Elliptochloris bilobata]|uniref:glycerophosphodiester phosphodiesterase n=1 Tax=Elliptochloris bilobata TaxID=381761 RepID=A0AAW1RU23_9CHLO
MVLPGPWNESVPGRPLVVSHRAGGNEAPENTLAALRSAEAAGSKVMQMDILPTREGTPVIFHDTSLKRATGLDADIRQVATRNLPQLLKVLQPLIPTASAEPVHTEDFKDGRRIPSLKELLLEADDSTYLLLEIWEESQPLVRAVADEVRRAGKADRVILGSLGSPAVWRMCHEELPEAQRILPMREIYWLYALHLLGLERCWKPPPGRSVFNIPLFTGWEAAFAKVLPITGWRALLMRLSFAFGRWLFPRPRLFAWLQERHSIPVVVFILSEPEDWKAALALNNGGPGSITAIMTDSPAALRTWLLGT